MVGYDTAYLIKYYPVEFIAAMLNSVMGINEKVAYYIAFAESLGIQVLPPDINESLTKFTVKGDTIRFGLGAIKNVGWNVVESIVKSREEKGNFENLYDFCNKVDLGTVNKRALDSLIKAGALDEFKVYRAQMLAVYEKIMDGIISQKKKNIEGQMTLFGAPEVKEENITISYPNIKEFDKKHKLAMEKEMTGLYITGHPLEDYEKSLSLQTSISLGKIMEEYNKEYGGVLLEEEGVTPDNPILLGNSLSISDNQKVKVGGIIAEVHRKITRNNDMMAFITLEDLTGNIECLVFPKTYDKLMNLLQVDEMVVIEGRLSLKEDELPKIICENIYSLEKVDNEKIYIAIEDYGDIYALKNSLKNIAEDYSGMNPIFVYTRKDKKSYRLSKEYWLDLGKFSIIDLKDIFGDKNVKIID